MINNIFEITKVRLYIDPATTSYVIQIVAGIIIAAGASIGIFWSRLKRAVSGKNKNKSGEEPINISDTDLGSNDIIRAEDLLDDEDK